MTHRGETPADEKSTESDRRRVERARGAGSDDSAPKETAAGTKTPRRGSSGNWHWTNEEAWLDVIFSSVRETGGREDGRDGQEVARDANSRPLAAPTHHWPRSENRDRRTIVRLHGERIQLANLSQSSARARENDPRSTATAYSECGRNRLFEEPPLDPSPA